MGSQGVGHKWSDLACTSAARQTQIKPTTQKGGPLAEKGEFIDTNESWDSVYSKYVWIQEHKSVLDLSHYTDVCTFICVTTHFSNLLSFVLAPFLVRLSPLGAARWWPAISFLHRSRVRHSLPGSGESRTEGHSGVSVDSVTQVSGLPTWN